MLWDGERSGLVGHQLTGVVASTVSKLTPNQSIESKFLYYLLSLNFEWIQNRRTGTGVPHVPKDLGRILKISYPSLSIQQKIARILQTVDRAIVKTEALIEKYQQIKAGLMHDLFTRGLWTQEELDRGDHLGTPAATAKPGQLRPTRQDAPHLYEQSPIGWIPKAWDTAPLGRICDVRGRVGWKGYTVEDLRDEGPLVLGAAQIGKDNRLDLSKPVFISRRKFEESPEIKVRKGDVLVVQRGTIGKIVFISQDIGAATINPSMILLTSFKAAPSFVYIWLCSEDAQRQIRLALSSTGVPMISQKQTGEMTCPLPSREEQEGITAILDRQNRLLMNCEARRDKLEKQKSGLMHDLLTGKVPVTPDH